MALEAVTLALTVWVCEAYWSFPLYVLAVIIIGSRLHALAILMHDAAHFRACRNRKVNDIVGELLAWPVTMTMQGYRNSHYSHHRELNTEKDLEWLRKMGQDEFKFPKTGLEIICVLVQFATGIKAYQELRDVRKVEGAVYVSPRLKRVRMACFAALVAASVYFTFWKGLLLYWVVPLFTSLLFFAYVRSVADHFCIEYSHPLNQTRTVVGPFWEMHLFAPHGINYHIEHHIFPGVPCHRLAELHRHLMTKETYVRHAHVTRGYGKLLKECMISSLRGNAQAL